MIYLTFFRLVLLASCLSFLWAGLFFFKRPQKKNTKFYLMNIFGLITICVSLYSSFIFSSKYFYFGGVLAIASFSLFWLTIRACKAQDMNFAFHGDTISRNLIIKGPYKFVRHPFYLSYLLAWLSAIMISGEFLLLSPFLCIMFFLYNLASSEEEKYFLDSDLSKRYKEYQKTTSKFIPNPLKIIKYKRSQSAAK